MDRGVPLIPFSRESRSEFGGGKMSPASQNHTTGYVTIGGLAGAVTGMVFWINQNVGVLFWLLLGLIALNVMAALVEKDLTAATHKWARVIAGVTVPSILPAFAHSANIVFTSTDIRTTVAAMFAALLSATAPDIMTAITKVESWLGAGKQMELATVAALKAENAKLKAEAAAVAQGQPSSAEPPKYHGVS